MHQKTTSQKKSNPIYLAYNKGFKRLIRYEPFVFLTRFRPKPSASGGLFIFYMIQPVKLKY